ncbi:hypothetical protein [Spirosoma sp. KUDC1026]|uniref:hypothetical protein n=1 Tax=Spirosoma sp. KUDC1026 TaxID=2745947 RepID=UPI00159BDB35|nr:hypothetical protein [Spirosoma sp. KUDC1026]QKZ15205.1 hypothetical protein HU175_22290 [Spirosoma sp. KUDC1026]
MADERPDEVLIKIRVSEEEVEKKIVQIRQQLTALKAEEKLLQKQYQESAIESDKYEAAMEGIVRQRSALTASLRENRKEMDNNRKVVVEAEGSLISLRANLSNLNKAYDSLSRADREGAAGGTLQKQINATNQELLEAEKLTDRYQRQVGNYAVVAKSIEPLIAELIKLQEEQKALDKGSPQYEAVGKRIIGFQQQINRVGAESGKTFDDVQDKVKTYGEAIRTTTTELVKLEEEQKALGQDGGEAYERIGFKIAGLKREISTVADEAKPAASAFDVLSEVTGGFGGRLDQVKGFLSNAKTGLSAFKGGLTGIKAAIAGTGIGLLVLAIGALITYLTKTQVGMDFLSRKMAGVGAAVDVVVGTIARAGEALTKVFTNPKKALLDFFDAFKGAGDAAAEAYKLGQAIERQNQIIRDSEQQVLLARAQNRAEIERLKLASEDVTKSTASRSKAAKAAFDLENATLKTQIALQEQRIKNIQAEIKLRGNLVSSEDRQKLIDAEIELADIREESFGKQTELNNSLNAINAEAAAKAKEAAKQAADNAVYLAELRVLQARQAGKDTLKLEEALIVAQGNAQKVGLAKNSKQRQLIDAQTNKAILDKRIEHAAELLNLEIGTRKAEISATLALTQRGSKQELDLRIEQIRQESRQQQVELEKQYKARQLNETQFRERQSDIVLNAERAIEDARAQFAQDQVQKQAAAAERRLQVEQDFGDQSLKVDIEIARKRIDLEEKTQVDLLDLQLKYGQITGEEYLNQINAVQAKALAARKENMRQEKELEHKNNLEIIDQKIADTKAGTIKYFKLQKQRLAEEQKAELDAVKGTEEEKEKEKEKIRAKYRTKNKELEVQTAEDIAGNILQATQTASSTLSSFVEASVQRQTKALDDQQEALLSSAALTSDQREKIEKDFQKKREKIEKEAAEKRRKIASIENIIATAQGITNAFKLPPPFNFITAALVGATGLANQILIDNQKFARGGYYRSDNRGAYVQGPGTGTSDSINARISNGEAIINARSTQKFYKELSAINVAGGGRAFPGLTANRLSTQNMTPTYNLGGVSLTTDAVAIARAVREGMKDVKTVVSVEAFDRVQKDIRKVEVQADL